MALLLRTFDITTLGTTILGIKTVYMTNAIQHKDTLTNANSAYKALTNNTRHIVTRQNDIWHYYTLNNDTRHLFGIMILGLKTTGITTLGIIM